MKMGQLRDAVYALEDSRGLADHGTKLVGPDIARKIVGLLTATLPAEAVIEVIWSQFGGGDGEE